MKITGIIIGLFITISIFAQVSPNKYCIEFTDKNNNGYSLDNPEEFLSERALQRRANQGILLNETDLPVTQAYVDSLESLGLEILNVSKWFNFVTVYTLDKELIDTITYLSFVSSSNKYQPFPEGISKEVDSKYKKSRNYPIGLKADDYYNYGDCAVQIKMHNAHNLHNDGYRGQGMMIAITDAGFTGLPDLPSFDSLYNDGRVLVTKNFVFGGDTVYDHSTHGMRVLSILAANYPGNLIGTAPEASYLLLMSEEPATETFIEELNWISAAEFADSMGADIINVSLGYVDFDTPEFNHAYEDLDGEHAAISIGAKVASSKGMLVVAAAANSGDDEDHPWIAAPGDAKDIITAGAVWSDETYAGFSSIGPSYDGRVKPDVVAMGGGTYNQELSGNIGNGNGTSFSTPLLAGMIACLWQKYPEKTNMEIIDAVQKSGHLYNTPTIYLGYGIPDFDLAGLILEKGEIVIPKRNFSVYPNPFKDTFNIQFENNPGDSIEIAISDMNGKKTYLWMEHTARESNVTIKIDDLRNFKSGIYILYVNFNNTRYSLKLVKSE
ncbi:MAG: serine protease [Marinilabiliales bacterium]|nr:MAG: serine protease [Marinilabiliales bacterium]